MSAKPRSNYAKLPWEIRKRILRLLFDGGEYEAINRDPEISRALAERKIKLHGSTFQAIRGSEEYRKYEAALMETSKQTERYKWASEALKNTAGLQDVANVAQMQLLEQLRDLSEKSDNLDGSDLVKIAGAITKIKESVENEKFAELKRKYSDLQNRFEEAEQEHAAEVASLLARHKAEVERLTAKDNTVADPSKVADELSSILGVKK